MKKNKPNLRDELRSIYLDQDGEMPDFKHMDHNKHSGLTSLLVKIIIVLLVLSTAAWTGFFFWTKGVLFNQSKPLVIAVEGPVEAVSGEEVTYTVRFTNTGKVPLAFLEAEIHTPLGLTAAVFTPPPTDGKNWNLGPITAGSDTAIKITGIFRAEVPSRQTLQTLVNYRPANFSSDFQDIKNTTIDVTDSILRLEVNGPEEAMVGDGVTYVVNVQNIGKKRLEKIQVSLDMPKDFILTSAKPAPAKEGLAKWKIGSLDPNGLFALTVKGRYSSAAEEEQTFRASLELLSDDESALLQRQDESPTAMLAGGLMNKIIVDGSPNDQNANPGETLFVSLHSENVGKEILSGLRVIASFSPPEGKNLPFAWSDVDLKGATRSGNTLIWSKTQIPGLAALAAEENVILDLTIPLAQKLSANTADIFTIDLQTEIASIGGKYEDREIDSTPLTVALNANLDAVVEARYFAKDGAPLGNGPLPPQVGIATTYTVNWQLSPTFHDLKQAVFSAHLPPNVSWIEKSEAKQGSLQFDGVTRTVRWSLGDLGAAAETAMATWQLSVTPTNSDLGTFMKLTNQTALEAKDTNTNALLAKTFEELTTEVPNDSFADGKGRVR